LHPPPEESFLPFHSISELGLAQFSSKNVPVQIMVMNGEFFVQEMIKKDHLQPKGPGRGQFQVLWMGWHRIGLDERDERDERDGVVAIYIYSTFPGRRGCRSGLPVGEVYRLMRGLLG
jgi:hypothetical protein